MTKRIFQSNNDDHRLKDEGRRMKDDRLLYQTSKYSSHIPSFPTCWPVHLHLQFICTHVSDYSIVLDLGASQNRTVITKSSPATRGSRLPAKPSLCCPYSRCTTIRMYTVRLYSTISVQSHCGGDTECRSADVIMLQRTRIVILRTCQRRKRRRVGNWGLGVWGGFKVKKGLWFLIIPCCRGDRPFLFQPSNPQVDSLGFWDLVSWVLGLAMTQSGLAQISCTHLL